MHHKLDLHDPYTELRKDRARKSLVFTLTSTLWKTLLSANRDTINTLQPDVNSSNWE